MDYKLTRRARIALAILLGGIIMTISATDTARPEAAATPEEARQFIEKAETRLLDLMIKAQRNKRIELDDLRAVAAGCAHCQAVGTSISTTLDARYGNHEVQDVNLNGHTPNMVDIDTRTLDLGRYFTPSEDRHAAYVCIIGASLVDQFFPAENPVGRTIRTGSLEFRVSEKGGVSVYGLGRFPVTLYYEQWTRLLDQADQLRSFLEENKSKLKLKGQ